MEALQSADDGNYLPLTAFLEELVIKSLQTTIDVLEGRDAFDFDDLARMFRNASEQSTAIERELGPATILPEMRSLETANKIAQIIRPLLDEHVQKATTPHVVQRANHNAGIPSVKSVADIRPKLGSPQQMIGVSEVQIQGLGKRFIPNAFVNFVLLSGRSQIALAATSRIARYSAQRTDILDSETESSVLFGSIYFADWDTKEISEFVLNALKSIFRAWVAEMDRRKTLIEAEEAEIDKYRSRRE